MQFGLRFCLSGILLLFCLLPSALGSRNQEEIDPDEGLLGSIKPRIPEPMVFDLVRPLGAKKKEVEINSLAARPLRRGGAAVDWAPEIEFTFMDGYALEFELPIENFTLQSYKLAAQGTFGTLMDRRAIHGWQVLAELYRHGEDRFSVYYLYLYGHRFNRKWSIFTMNCSGSA